MCLCLCFLFMFVRMFVSMFVRLRLWHHTVIIVSWIRLIFADISIFYVLVLTFCIFLSFVFWCYIFMHFYLLRVGVNFLYISIFCVLGLKSKRYFYLLCFGFILQNGSCLILSDLMWWCGVMWWWWQWSWWWQELIDLASWNPLTICKAAVSAAELC